MGVTALGSRDWLGRRESLGGELGRLDGHLMHRTPKGRPSVSGHHKQRHSVGRSSVGLTLGGLVGLG